MRVEAQEADRGQEGTAEICRISCQHRVTISNATRTALVNSRSVIKRQVGLLLALKQSIKDRVRRLAPPSSDIAGQAATKPATEVASRLDANRCDATQGQHAA